MIIIIIIEINLTYILQTYFFLRLKALAHICKMKYDLQWW